MSESRVLQGELGAGSRRVIVLASRFNEFVVSGLVKDFLERIYPWFEEVPNRRPGMPYLLVAKGGNDGTGARLDGVP